MVYEMSKKRALLYVVLALLTFLGSSMTMLYALANTEKRQVIYTASFRIGAQQQKFKAFYASAPYEGFLITFSVSSGAIKFSEFPAPQFEESLGYVDVYKNGTLAEKRQYWIFQGNNGTCGVSADTSDAGVWYLQFCNEDTYEKTITIEITKFWKVPIYQSWFD